MTHPNQNQNTADRILQELITSRGDTNRVLQQHSQQIIQLTLYGYLLRIRR